MALILAVIGLFGLVAYSVSQRRRELAVRMALGASAKDLLITSMRTAMVLAGLGVAAGLSTALSLTRYIEGQLYGIDPPHVPAFVGAAILMIATAGIGAYFPARRAAHADAMTALRCE